MNKLKNDLSWPLAIFLCTFGIFGLLVILSITYDLPFEKTNKEE